jgi:hypothetical protein
MALTKIGFPSWFVSDYPSRIDNAPTIPPTGKTVVSHLLDNEITDAQKFARGITHLQKLYDNSFDKNRKAYILLPEFGTNTPDTSQINSYANNIAANILPNAVIGDQFTEGGSNPILPENYYNVATQFYLQLGAQLGVSGAQFTNFMGTYDSGFANFNPDFFKIVGIGGRNPVHSRFLAALGSQAGARKKARNQNVGDFMSPQADDQFFTSGMYQYCNSFNMMLYANDDAPIDWLYSGIFEAQRKYAANINAKSLWYTSPWSQSILTPINTQSRNSGWIHERTGGYWKVPNWHVVPLSLMYQLGFLGCLLSEGIYIWEVGLLFSKNISNDRNDPYIPTRTWESTGGSAPTLLPYGSPYYPTYPETGVDAAVAGVHTYNAVRDIVEASSGIAYAAYTSDINGSVGVTAGDARLFRRGFQNFGQNTILQLANTKKGIALACNGNGKTLLVYINPYRSATKKETISVTFNSITYNLGNLEGDTLHVFTYTPTYTEIRTSSGGVDMLILVPSTYNPAIPTKLIYHHHGLGGDRESVLFYDQKPVNERLLADGHIVVGISGGNGWGNDTSLNKYITAHNYILANYNISKTIISSQSMGGLTGLLSIINNSLTNVKGWFGIYPVCDLQSVYWTGGQQSIHDAYGVGSYGAIPSGHNPVVLPNTNFIGMRTRFYASNGDTSVLKNQNTDVMKALVAPVTLESDVILCTGNHGDLSHFQPNDVSSFVSRVN